MITIKMFRYIFITGLLWILLVSSAQASIVQRTITIDGNFGDWDGTTTVTAPPNTNSSPGTNIITNPGQFSFDDLETATSPTPPTGQASCLDKDAVYKATPSPNCALQSTGRDLQYFTYTYTSTRLYVYVQRYSSSTNATDWYFYLDANGNGRLSDGERVLGVSWNGSNGNITHTLWTYDAVDNVSGDPLVSGGSGDGYDMPGSLSGALTYNLTASLTGGSTSGALAGRQMEAQILWSDVCSGCSGPQNINFHISSSRGTNLPSQLEDNMVGTPGGIITYDLGVSKTSSVNAIAVNGAFSYTVTVTNNSAGAANGVTLTDLLPAQVTFNSFSGTGSYNSGTGLWTIGTIAGSGTATATFNVTANATGTPNNTATLTYSDTDNSNNAASKQVTINAAGDLSVTKTASSTLVNSGNAFSYTVSVTNGGASTASGLTLSDVLPSGVTFVSSSCTTGTYSNGTGIWTIGSIAASATASCVLNVTANTVATPTVVTNTATLSYSDSNNANNTASINVTVNPAVDVAVAKTSNLDAMVVGSGFTYTVTVTNNSATYSAGAVTLTDVLPAQVTFNSFSGTGSYNSGTGLWTIGTLAASGTATATFTVTANATGTPTNTATLTNSDTNNTNNTASKQVTINAAGDLSVTKTASSTLVNSGNAFSYTVSVTNGGASTASGLTLSDVLPSGVTFVSSSCTTGTYSNGTGIWTIGSIAASATASCVLNVTANTVATPTVVTNTATLSYSDSNNSNNTASINVTVNPAVDVAVAKTSSLDVLAVGSGFTYTVTVTNNSATYSAGAVTLTDVLPAQVTFNAFSGTGSYNSGTGLWTIGTLAASGTATATFTVTANATGTPTNTATLTNSDTNNTNNAASKQVTINPAGDVSVTKTVSSPSVGSGNAFSYTVSVTNGGASAVNGMILNDSMPSGVTFVSSTSVTGSYNSGTGVWTIGTIAAGATVSRVFNVTANSVLVATVVTNTATLPYADSNNANNAASVNVTVNPSLPMLSITKISNAASANPSEVITYTITVQNMGAAAAESLEINDDMSPYSAIDIDADNNGGNGLNPFVFNAGTSTLTLGTISYTNNAIPYSPLVSGGSGASAGFDGSPTDWKILMTGSMPAGTSFTLTYYVEVK